ncbi:pyrroline-5-carboxylate reductase [Candidatus Bipolaricaulota bacterium]
MKTERMAILGGGNLGAAIARGLVSSEARLPANITITRRSGVPLEVFGEEGFRTSTNNVSAIDDASVVLIAVRPRQMDAVLDQLAGNLDPSRHVLISTVSDVRIEDIQQHVGSSIPIIRAMPNIGVAVGMSMTCLSCHASTPSNAKQLASELFSHLGRVEFIEEEQLTPATALCACGIAFFLRAIRAASQGGVQVGFHADEAIRLAAQTAKGAAELILSSGEHPESLIDTVTTPLGITIAGLNEMEHYGFGSALIRGIVVSAEKAGNLYGASKVSD